jgi:hypothetical protein
MKKDDELRQKFAKRFEDFEAEPQEKSWEIIQEAIRPKRKRRAIWFFFGWGCLAFLVAAIGLFWFQSSSVQVAVIQPTVPEQSNEFQNQEQTKAQAINPEVLQNQRLSTTQHLKILPLSDHSTAVSNRAFWDLEAPQSLSIQHHNREQPMWLQPDPEANTAATPPMGEQDDMDKASHQISTQLLSSLPFQAIQILPETKTAANFPAIRVNAAQHPGVRKGKFTASVSLLSTYQVMQGQVYNGLNASDFNILPALNAQRLGTSLSLGYRLPLGRNSNIHAAFQWMNLPFRAEYTVNNIRQVNIEILSAAQYRVSPNPVGAVYERKRLNYWGLQLDYGHTYHLFHQRIRVFAGGEGLWLASNGKPELWALAGLNIPLGLWRFELRPVFKYQLNQIEQPDHLAKTRLYTVGLGIQTTF